MALQLLSPEKQVRRRVKAHRKSRAGCGNCKLRSVKCDESKPRCKRCTAYGVFCNYNYEHSELQLSADGALNIELPQIKPRLLNQSIPSTIIPSWTQVSTASRESNARYQLREQDLELLLSKFQRRTVLTISTDKNRGIYQKEMIRLGFLHPFLMHALLSLTLMHDRHLSMAPNAKLSPAEAFHWCQGMALFNNKLSGPIHPSERDALWATAVLIGIAAFHYIEAATPEEAWPLQPSSSLNLSWQRMGAGKKEIWKITQPLRADCVFRPLVTEDGSFLPIVSAGPRLGLEALPPEFIGLYDLNNASTPDTNPYRDAASSLAQSLHSTCDLTTILNFVSFISQMHPDYRSLLERKDPRALLLLAYWYARVYRCGLWWILRRVELECRAICLYLERYHRHETIIQELLLFPRIACGLDASME